MNERDAFNAGREALSDVAADPNRPSRHERTLLRYLSGARYAAERAHEHAHATAARLPEADQVRPADEAVERGGRWAGTPGERLVVVGVDDSPGSFVALDHAAIEADLRGWPLRVVHVQHRTGAADADQEHDGGAELLRETSDRVRYRAPAIAVTSELLVGSASGLLVARSATAGLLVVGSHGRGGLAGLLAGSVSSQVAAQARGPVMVVRVPAWPPSAGWPSLPVVVGVDGSAASAAALRFAAAEARLRGVPLLVLHALAIARPQAERLDPILAGAVRQAGRTPELAVRGRGEPGDPRQVLLDASRRAAAIVVGPRGGGGLAELRLGSVTQAVMRHAHCPVFVTHEH